MKKNKSKILFVFGLILSITANAQKVLKVNKIKLPADIAYYDNQFSSLYIYQDKLFFMSESRIEDNRPAFIAYTPLKETDIALKDSNYSPSFHSIQLKNLDKISSILKERNQQYEGLEAMAIDNNWFYFSIETNTPSDSCYIIKGEWKDSAIVLDDTHFLSIAKPKDSTGNNIYNAGFESIEIEHHQLYAFFEYNYFKKQNYVIKADESLDNTTIQKILIDKIPFRLTDVSWDNKGDNTFGINFFFKGGGKDAVYRVPKEDSNYHCMYANNELTNYARIIKIHHGKENFDYSIVADIPLQYWSYNWEGIAKYKNGFFIINDKYTPQRPYSTVLLYLSY